MISTKLVVVAGAALPGIGEAITRSLLGKGYSVVGTYEADNFAEAQQLSSEFAGDKLLRMAQVDHASRTSLVEFASSITDPINGFIDAQFFFSIENPDNFDYDLWEKSLAINLTAPNILVHELKTKIIEGGSIVVITSTEGFIGSFGASAYAASKAAVHNLIKTLANNLGKKKIRVNAIAAGWIGGVMDTDEVFNMSRQITPLGKLGSSEEIAHVANFLLSAESSFINGSVITADGGYTGVDTIAKFEFDQTSKV